MIPNIALVVTYFGKLPFWFPAFLESCKYNPDVQWILFSDSQAPVNCPANVTFIHLSIDTFCALVNEKLNIKVNLTEEFLYKVVDFKPAFGWIYQDYLEEYDFWGHCDIDIIWGRIAHFITPEILNRFEIITSRVERISGHFCIYRNTYNVNSLFTAMPWTKEYLQRSGKCMRLTEEHFSKYIHWLKSPTFPSKVKQFFCGKPYTPTIYWDQILTTSGKHQRSMLTKPEKKMRWSEGRAYNADGEEAMYLHFHVLKNTIKSIDFDYMDNPDEFYILHDQIAQNYR